MRKGRQTNQGLLDAHPLGSEESESLWESVERTYKSSERRYRLLAENVTDVIWTIDLDYRYTYISPSVVNMRGYTAEQAMKQSLSESFTKPSYHVIRKVLEEELFMIQDSSKSITLEIDQLCKDGAIICTETKISCLRDKGNDIIGVLGVARDITERKRMQDQMKQSDLLASLGKMTAGIAHEVNNPLGSILLFSEMMIKSCNIPDIKKDLRVIHDEAKRAAKVMSDLLTYSLSNSNKIDKVDLLSVINKVLDMRLYAETVMNISVYTHFPEEPVTVFGDRSQLAQVFMNLMLNAEEALENNNGGNVHIEAKLSAEWVEITVADDGIGIAEENIGQIFYPFYTTKGIGEGTGLGLSTCYGIITSHGGLIKAKNNDKGGVSIVIELPLASPAI